MSRVHNYSNSLHPKGQNILVGQIIRAGGEFLRAAGEIPHHFISLYVKRSPAVDNPLVFYRSLLS